MEMRVKWEEMFGHLWYIMLYSWVYAPITSICPWHVQHPVQYYYIIPFHGIPGIETVYMCIRDVQQREICEKIVTLLQQWTPIEITTHSAYSILLCFMCLYVFVCVQPAVLGRRGRNIYYTVFSTRNQIPYIYTQIFYFYYDCQERSTRIIQKFIGR
jgi:hypothetical protein